MVRTKKWQSGSCGLNVTISASCDWSVATFTTSLECQESYLTLRNVTLKITRDFFRLHNTFAWLYNAAPSPASRLCSAGSLAIILHGVMMTRVTVICKLCYEELVYNSYQLWALQCLPEIYERCLFPLLCPNPLGISTICREVLYGYFQPTKSFTIFMEIREDMD